MSTTWNTYTKLMVYIVVADPSTQQTTIYQSDGSTPVQTNPFSRSYWQTAINPVTRGYHNMGSKIYNFYGDLGEIVVYKRALSTTSTPRLADVAANLRAKWSIT